MSRQHPCHHLRRASVDAVNASPAPPQNETSERGDSFLGPRVPASHFAGASLLLCCEALPHLAIQRVQNNSPLQNCRLFNCSLIHQGDVQRSLGQELHATHAHTHVAGTEVPLLVKTRSASATETPLSQSNNGEWQWIPLPLQRPAPSLLDQRQHSILADLDA